MSSLDEIRGLRIQKLNLLRKKGINPYPSESKRELSLEEAINSFDELEKSKESKWVAGRIMSMRGQGAIVFVTLYDGTANFQGLLKKDVIGEDKLNFWSEAVDIGDFVELHGTFFTTNRGEKTIEAKDWRMLSKSLRPLPEKWHGLEDEEIKLRKRYLDILTDPEVKEIFIKKNKFWSTMRSFLVDKGFLELEMPVLESTPGGAEAEPFRTHHNALDHEFFLRISLELPLKKMLVAGYEKVFEIGRIFRNEGISNTHLQDYTQMEFYWAYGDFEKLMAFSEEMYKDIIIKTFGTYKLTYHGETVDWGREWGRVDYVELFKENTGIDLLTAIDKDLKHYVKENKIDCEDFAERGRLIDLIFKDMRKKGIKGIDASKPFFLINQPVELEPLAKKDEKNPKIVQRLQIIVYSMELGKGFGELNDPEDQRERFNAQMKLRESGDNEAQMIDEEYLEAMEYGMPPAAGFGVSERLFSVLIEGDKSVRETQVFPLMRPEKNQEGQGKKETMLTVAVLNKEVAMEPWQELNTIAHLNAAFGARVGKELFTKDTVTSKDKQKIKLNTKNAIMIKVSNSKKALHEFLDKARKSNLEISEFTREMLETTNDKKITEITASKNLDDIEHLGVLVYGPKTAVEELTSGFKLYS